MATTTEEVVVKLNNQAGGAVAGLVDQLNQLGSVVAGNADKLREMNAQFAIMQSAGQVDSAPARALAVAIGEQEVALRGAQEAYIAMGGSAVSAANLAKGGMAALAAAEQKVAAEATKAAAAETKAAAAATKANEKAAKAAEALAQKNAKAADAAGKAKVPFESLAGSVTILGGSAGPAGAKMINLVKFMGKLGPEAAIAAAAIVALVAVFAVFAAIVIKGISAADDYRNELLKLQGASKGSASAAHELQAAINAVAPATALARDKVTDYATQLSAAGLKGAELQRALEAMAIAGSAGGDAVAAAFLKDVQAAKAAGGSVDALSAKMKKQLGGVAAAQLLSLDAQLLKFKENIAALFSGANIEPFLKGLHSILALFDQNSASGKALKATITSMVEAGISGALRFAIAMVKMYSAVKGSTVAMFTLKAVLITIAIVLGLIAVAALVAAAAIAIPFLLLAAPILIAVALVMAIYDACVAAWNGIASIDWGAVGSAIMSPFTAAWDFLAGLPGKFTSVGGEMIDGLVSGIMGGAGKIVSAVTGAVGGAISAAKAALGIASPSKVFAALGGHTAAGFAEGVDSGAPDAQASMTKMVAPPPVSAASAKGGPSLTFNNCTFGEGTSEASLRVWLLNILAGEAMSPEPAT